MLEINLIRWRSIERHRNFSQLLFGVFIAALLALSLVWLLYKSSGAELEHEAYALQEKLNSLEKIKLVSQKHRVTIPQLDIYQQQYNKIMNIILTHSKTHELFEILDSLVPEQVTLIEIHFKGQHLWLKGVSQSNSDLSDFLIQLSQLTDFRQPKLSFSLQKDMSHHQELSQGSKRFELQVSYLSDHHIKNNGDFQTGNLSNTSKGK